MIENSKIEDKILKVCSKESKRYSNLMRGFMEQSTNKFRKRRDYLNAYDYYHAVYKRVKHFRKLSEKQFIDIINLYSYFLIDQLLEEGTVNFPFLGRIYVIGRVPKETKYLPVDWGKTNKLWKEKPELAKRKFIYFTNEHSDGVFYYMSWSRKGCQAWNKNFYYFLPTSIFRKKLSNKIKSGKVYRTI